MIQREREMNNLHGLGTRHRLVGMVGARQVRKATFKVNCVKIMELDYYDER
jgi:hypothetical protein